MSETVVRKFKQINRTQGHDYLAKEIHFVQVSPGKMKSIIILDDDSRTDGPTVDEKFYKMNMEGFDIIYPAKDGKEQKSRYSGMLESKCFEEIVEKIAPVEVTITVEASSEEADEGQKTA